MLSEWGCDGCLRPRVEAGSVANARLMLGSALVVRCSAFCGAADFHDAVVVVLWMGCGVVEVADSRCSAWTFLICVAQDGHDRPLLVYRVADVDMFCLRLLLVDEPRITAIRLLNLNPQCQPCSSCRHK